MAIITLSTHTHLKCAFCPFNLADRFVWLQSILSEECRAVGTRARFAFQKDTNRGKEEQREHIIKHTAEYYPNHLCFTIILGRAFLQVTHSKKQKDKWCRPYFEARTIVFALCTQRTWRTVLFLWFGFGFRLTTKDHRFFSHSIYFFIRIGGTFFGWNKLHTDKKR